MTSPPLLQSTQCSISQAHKLCITRGWDQNAIRLISLSASLHHMVSVMVLMVASIKETCKPIRSKCRESVGVYVTIITATFRPVGIPFNLTCCLLTRTCFYFEVNKMYRIIQIQSARCSTVRRCLSSLSHVSSTCDSVVVFSSPSVMMSSILASLFSALLPFLVNREFLLPFFLTILSILI